MKKKKTPFLLIALLLCACFLGACSKESAVVQPNDRTQPDNSAADKNSLPRESVSPEPKADENETQTDTDEPLTWQSAYLEIICHMEDYLPLNLSYPDKTDSRKNSIYYDPDHKEGYVGIHDFDGNGIPELLAGDYMGMGVFTFSEGKAEKIADLYWPDYYDWCINGAYFKDNSISLNCDGSTGSWFVCFGFVAGEYRLGRYYKYSSNPELKGNGFTDVTLNGEPSTREEMDTIYNTNWDERDRETELRNKVEIINQGRTWVLKYQLSEEEFQLNQDFDFELIRW